MILDAAVSFGAMTVLAGPAEWAVHKYLLHSKSRKHPFIERAAIAHNDNHHGAYLAPHHYYRDLTNEHVTVHFAKKDVGIIAAATAAAGLSFSAVGFNPIVSSTATAAAGLMAYGLYESTHHYMHVIGERRLQIGRIFGDIIENGERSGKLRLPKPTLDDLCTTIDSRMEGKSREFTYKDNCSEVLAKQGYDVDVLQTIEEATSKLSEWENTNLDTYTPDQLKTYQRERRIQKVLRDNPVFRHLDNHHFVHHRRYGNNLNVVWTWFDSLIGTKADSNVKELMENKRYWLCPNSPDTDKFEKI